MNYVIKRLTFGSVRIDASMTVRGVVPGTVIEVPAQGYLLLSDGPPVLVDAGFGDPAVLGAGGTVADGQGFTEQLQRHGVAAADLAAVVLTHLHRDHAGNLEHVPPTVPVVVNRSELASACSGIQGTAYARTHLHQLIDRLYTPGAMTILDLEHSGPVEVFPDVLCQLSGGHTPGSLALIVPTDAGSAYLCGDLFYDVRTALHDQPRETFVAAVQPAGLVASDPGLSNNFTTSVLQEIGAIKRARRFRFLLPAHDDPGVLDRGRFVGSILGDTIPGPMAPVSGQRPTPDGRQDS